MKKQILSISLALTVAAGCTAAVTAQDKTPSVFVNSGEIMFDDQKPVILNDRTLVPARGVFEAMGAKVTWDGEARLVEVTSPDNKTVIKLTIDDSTMRVYDISGIFGALLAGQDFNAPETPVVLDVAPQIMNDRTMIPLRAISEAMGADVKWDDKEYTVDITTKVAPTDADKALLPSLSLSSDTTSVKMGEDVVLYINAKNIPAERFVSGVTATVKYDKESFEFVSASLVNGENEIPSDIGGENADFGGAFLKVAYATVNQEQAVKEDGAVMKLTFKSLNGNKGEFALSNGYNSKLGYNTSVIFAAADYSQETVEGNDLAIDTTAVLVNDPSATAAPETTADPSATAAPETTADPSATTAPETTTDPSATAAPETTTDPSATAAPETTADPSATTTPTVSPKA